MRWGRLDSNQHLVRYEQSVLTFEPHPPKASLDAPLAVEHLLVSAPASLGRFLLSGKREIRVPGGKSFSCCFDLRPVGPLVLGFLLSADRLGLGSAFPLMLVCLPLLPLRLPALDDPRHEVAETSLGHGASGEERWRGSLGASFEEATPCRGRRGRVGCRTHKAVTKIPNPLSMLFGSEVTACSEFYARKPSSFFLPLLPFKIRRAVRIPYRKDSKSPKGNSPIPSQA